MMPKILQHGLLGFGTFSVFLAIILPLGEHGPWKVVVPILALIPIGLIAAYWRRAPQSDILLRAYCGVVAVVGLIFVAFQILAISSILITPQNILMICNTLVTGCLFFVLGHPSVRHWFTPN
jgi:hypothetical protein